MKEPQKFYGVCFRKRNRVQDLSLSLFTHKPQFPTSLSSCSYPKNLYIFLGVIHWRQSSGAPFRGTTLLTLKQSYPTPSYLPCSGQRTDPLNTSALQTSRFQSDQIWPGPKQLPPAPDQPLSVLLCSQEWEVISNLTQLKALKEMVWVYQTRKTRREFFGSKILSTSVICTVFSVQMHPSKFYMTDAL